MFEDRIQALIKLKGALMVNYKQDRTMIYSEQIAKILLLLQCSQEDRSESCNMLENGILLSEKEREIVLSTLNNLDLRDDSLFDCIYEIFTDHTYKQRCGQFFTPQELANMMAEMVVNDSERIIMDTSSGMGSLLTAAGRQCVDYNKVKLIGIEKDPVLANISDLKLKREFGIHNKIICADSFDNQINLPVPDIILSNPPFGLKIGTELSEVAFVKRNIELLKEGGIMVTVVPDGVLGNSKNVDLRRWILSQGQILGIVDIPYETFMPHTSIKTSILVFQKKTSIEDYKIFMAISEKCGHDRRGKMTGDCDFSNIAEAFKTWRKK
jgi:type I restriction enzyme M protein